MQGGCKNKKSLSCLWFLCCLPSVCTPSYLISHVIIVCPIHAVLHDVGRPWDRQRTKYQLLHTVTVNQVADIRSNGVYMRSPVINATAVGAISTNLRHMAPRMLPLPLLVQHLSQTSGRK